MDYLLQDEKTLGNLQEDNDILVKRPENLMCYHQLSQTSKPERIAHREILIIIVSRILLF